MGLNCRGDLDPPPPAAAIVGSRPGEDMKGLLALSETAGSSMLHCLLNCWDEKKRGALQQNTYKTPCKNTHMVV